MARPSKPLISRSAVVKAALKIVDRDGLNKLSLKRLASEVGVHESSIYYHYRYKHDILADALRHVLSDLKVGEVDRSDWKAYLFESALPYYRALAKHPEMVAVLMKETPRSFGLDFENQTAGVLLDAGFEPHIALAVREQLEALTNGALQFAERRLFKDVPESLPQLRKIVAEKQISPEERFRMSLRAYIDGLQIQLDERAATGSP
jgi:AcrR family transcriptional regulator